MPKQKSNRSAAKRFKMTGGKNVKRSQAGVRHLLTSKNRKQKRHLRGTVAVHEADLVHVKNLLPGA